MTWKICAVCGEYKQHRGKGMCSKCRQREHRIRKPTAKRPMNKKSGNYLGCTIAEKVLSNVFKDIKVMKPCNPGFDFICSKEKKVDVKSSCIGKNGWIFGIRRNTTADFFLCIAFDNRKSLIPLHLWLIPSSEVRDKVTVGIRPTTIHKWDEFRLDISKTLQCCDEMRP